MISVKPTEIYQSQPEIILNLLVALGNCLFFFASAEEISQILNQISWNFSLVKAHVSGFYPPIRSRSSYAEPKAQDSVQAINPCRASLSNLIHQLSLDHSPDLSIVFTTEIHCSHRLSTTHLQPSVCLFTAKSTSSSDQCQHNWDTTQWLSQKSWSGGQHRQAAQTRLSENCISSIHCCFWGRCLKAFPSITKAQSNTMRPQH